MAVIAEIVIPRPTGGDETPKPGPTIDGQCDCATGGERGPVPQRMVQIIGQIATTVCQVVNGKSWPVYSRA